MSLGEAPGKFPGQQSRDQVGPGPSALNPAGVFPHSDPSPDPNPPKREGRGMFQSIENPYKLQEAVNKLESALDDIIEMFEEESKTTGAEGSFTAGREGIELFTSWKRTLDEIKAGKR